jgi:hypothetical protein
LTRWRVPWCPEVPAMDAVLLLITAAFFALTWGFVLLCERV